MVFGYWSNFNNDMRHENSLCKRVSVYSINYLYQFINWASMKLKWLRVE
jgi:hypothetical protein